MSTKAEAIDCAARAEYEATKVSIQELWHTTWETLPDTDGQLPSPRSKAYYREHVSTGVEALARAHLLVATGRRITRELIVACIVGTWGPSYAGSNTKAAQVICVLKAAGFEAPDDLADAWPLPSRGAE
jgi:hypothetical protein